MKKIITATLVIACYGCVVLAAKLFDYRAAALVLGGMLLSSAVLGLVESEGEQMSLNKGMFTSTTDMWETPQEFFDRWNAVYHFDLDVCAIPENAKCKQYFTPEQDALQQEWNGVCWMNPPYGREIGRWVKKAYESAQKNGATVVCLLPARTDTAWWHDYCIHGDITFIRGRLRFGGSKNSAPFPSAVVVFTCGK